MGAEPWSYFVPFEPSIDAALQKLRQRVFESGDYRGSERNPATPEDALQNSGEEGTGSILDIMQVGASPQICTVCPLSEAQLSSFFGTTQPTRQMIEANMDYYEDIGRGEGIYITVYKDDKPHEYFFAGYSFD